MDFLDIIEQEKQREIAKQKQLEKEEKLRKEEEIKRKKQQKKQQRKERIADFFSGIADFFDEGIGYWLTLPVLWPYQVIKELVTSACSSPASKSLLAGVLMDVVIGGLVLGGFAIGQAIETDKYLNEYNYAQTQIVEQIKEDINFSFVDTPQAFEIKTADGQTYVLDFYFKGAERVSDDKTYFTASYEVNQELAKKLENFTLKQNYNEDDKFTGFSNSGYKERGMVNREAQSKMEIWKEIEAAIENKDCKSITHLSTGQVTMLEAELAISKESAVKLAQKMLDELVFVNEDERSL